MDNTQFEKELVADELFLLSDINDQEVNDETISVSGRRESESLDA
jgi:hypothetical protein